MFSETSHIKTLAHKSRYSFQEPVVNVVDHTSEKRTLPSHETVTPGTGSLRHFPSSGSGGNSLPTKPWIDESRDGGGRAATSARETAYDTTPPVACSLSR